MIFDLFQQSLWLPLIQFSHALMSFCYCPDYIQYDVLLVDQVCVDIGACEPEEFDFVHEPQDYTQEQWDDRCYVCQAFAKDLEVRKYVRRVRRRMPWSCVLVGVVL